VGELLEDWGGGHEGDREETLYALGFIFCTAPETTLIESPVFVLRHNLGSGEAQECLILRPAPVETAHTIAIAGAGVTGGVIYHADRSFGSHLVEGFLVDIGRI
jgi:hypothetical protein